MKAAIIILREKKYCFLNKLLGILILPLVSIFDKKKVIYMYIQFFNRIAGKREATSMYIRSFWKNFTRKINLQERKCRLFIWTTTFSLPMLISLILLVEYVRYYVMYRYRMDELVHICNILTVRKIHLHTYNKADATNFFSQNVCEVSLILPSQIFMSSSVCLS